MTAACGGLRAVALDRYKERAHVQCAHGELHRDRFLFAHGLDEGGQNGIQSNCDPVSSYGVAGLATGLTFKG